MNRNSIDSYQPLFEQLGHGATVITGNARLSLEIGRAWNRHCMEQGLEVWPTADVLPWGSWVQRCWQNAVVDGRLSAPVMLLNRQQEAQVWEQALAKDADEHPLLQLSSTARQAQQTWQLLQDWQVKPDEDGFSWNEDSQALLRWVTSFKKHCRDKRWLSESDLPSLLQNHFQAAEDFGNSHFILIGFDELVPAQHALLEHMQVCGCEVVWLGLEAMSSTIVVHGSADSRQEIETAGRWARQRLQHNPDARIGIVVIDLAAVQHEIRQRFDDIFTPGIAFATDSEPVYRPYNLSLGLPLSDYPLIRSAFQLLQLGRRRSGIHEVSRVLRSPFIQGWDQEQAARIAIDRQLWDSGETEVTLSTLIYYAGREGKATHSPLLLQQLLAFRELLDEAGSTLTAGEWVTHFSRLLDVIGWSRGRALNSAEYQARETWQSVLSGFGAQEPVLSRLNRGEALSLLERLAREQVFQPEARNEPIQVLGLYESIGLQFDHLWVMGMGEHVWPAAPRPNPFIPLNLQRSLAMPRASAERELAIARQMTERLLGSAPEVVVSYPRMEGETGLRMSPLVSAFEEVTDDALDLWSEPLWCERIHRQSDLEGLDDSQPIPVAEEEVRGGSRIFKNQAQCPFRAFAESRLGARTLGTAEIGLNAMARGSLLHQVLEKTWNEIKTQQALLAFSAEELQQLVGRQVASVIEDSKPFYPHTMTPRFCEVEADRLQSHALAWLELEKQREPFSVVATEQEMNPAIGGLSFRLSIDRIDKLENGSHVVIDYKTGNVRPADWFGERPDDPQLPLYSAVLEGDVSAIAFAQIKAGEVAFKGVAEADDLLPGVKGFDKLGSRYEVADSWQAVLADWRTTLENLAADFHAGRLEVDPKVYPNTCGYCDLQSLCRVNEELAFEEGEDDA